MLTDIAALGLFCRLVLIQAGHSSKTWIPKSRNLAALINGLYSWSFH
jgi:hypothetical protein